MNPTDGCKAAKHKGNGQILRIWNTWVGLITQFYKRHATWGSCVEVCVTICVIHKEFANKFALWFLVSAAIRSSI